VATTINDVAARAGVSIKTVSRVVNREPNVAPATRERVEAVLVELDYRPNLFARSLAGSRSYLLSLLFDNPSPSYVYDLQLGALRRCRDAGRHLVVEAVDSTAADFDNQLAAVLKGSLADGFILSAPLCDNPRVIAALEAKGVPYVRITPYNEAVGPAVRIDDGQAAFQLTEHLLQHGHRRIGFIRGHADHGSTRLRHSGFIAAMDTWGLKPEEVEQGDFTSRSGAEAAERLLAGPNRPSAIFASNDDMALGVMLTASRLGLHIPEDLSVCGFDDSRLAQLTYPQLTTVRQPLAELGAAAVDLLVESAQGADAQRDFDLEIVVRGSTGPAPT
jgi:LacI family transcriptional regulator